MTEEEENPAPAQASASEYVLPPFPIGRLGTTPNSVKDTYAWMACLIKSYGDAAPSYVEAQKSIAVLNNDMVSWRGWYNIGVALAGFARLAADGETSH